MANRLFQMARSAVQNAVGKFQGSSHEEKSHSETSSSFSGHDMEIAQNALSSAMANSSDAERAQLAELQQELDAHSGTSQAGTAAASMMQDEAGTNSVEDLFENNQQ
ncbi:DUF3813 domain-containing protein [Fictibacillus barbaricus]|uniref:DUF3813 domain-containing protein n=1 Tax=Fictibacillus barbaricus TaxID=182136 RepID=A0ABU1TXN8_9BACL|nr:hypothetical protein [Fictibacillus barbaricus]